MLKVCDLVWTKKSVHLFVVFAKVYSAIVKTRIFFSPTIQYISYWATCSTVQQQAHTTNVGGSMQVSKCVCVCVCVCASSIEYLP